MDIAEPLLASNAGNKYVLVVIDYFSKWSEIYPIANQEAKTIAKVFVNNWVTRFGTPIELHSDQDRNFETSIFQEVCQIFGINKTRTTPVHPQSDGMAERFNRTFQEHLRKVIDNNQQDWDEHIPIFLMAYRSAVHNTTALPPPKILFGSNLRLPADLKFGTPPNVQRTETEYVARLRHTCNAVFEEYGSQLLSMRLIGPSLSELPLLRSKI
uniref:Integrase catalytic domain-containing protein n=1 Tax=Glossina morsitans morsitans TaxID=37546 RepID=A0A1B0G9X5_GLOMM